MTDLTAELVVDGRSPREPVLAPDGRSVCYVLAPASRAGEHLDTELWLAGTDDAGKPGQVAGGATVFRPRWSADPAALFFLSDEADRGTAQLHRLTVADGAVTALTSWRTGIDDHLPLADPDLVALLAEDEPTEEDARRAREGDDAVVVGEREPVARLRLLDLRTGRVTTPDVFAGRHVVELAQRPDGGPLAVLSQASADSDHGPRSGELHLFDPATGTAVDLGPVTGADARSLAWWPGEDGWHLGYLAMTPPLLQAGTAVFDLAVDDGALSNRTSGLPMCPTELCQTGGAPLVVFADGLDSTLARLDTTGPTVLSRHQGRLDDLSCTPGGETVAVLAGTRYHPSEVHIGPPAGPLRKVTDTRPELDGIAFGEQRRLAYRAADGLDLDGLLVLPAGRTAQDGPFPLVTIVHGGPYERYADSFQLVWAPSAQWLATAGYAVFLPNERGGEGHGHEFAASVAERVGQEEWTDVLAGIDLLVAEGVADPDRLGITGWSHGGFMAAWAVGHTDRFRAALVGAGVTDWGMLAACGENGEFETALGGRAGWFGPGPHLHDELSPISYAGDIRTPVLILHGEADTNVPLGQAVYLHRALRHFGVEHELVVYPREGHLIGERQHQLDVLRRTRAWFDRWL